ncbi:outer membrane biogenesis protein BamB [Polystyrenella longa]|uniref:Outer membrane biogenesis protein BamB n=1 Tax=Polystyrenella longa TaxID=2528007 RepID=A0A518CP51_9PLAN|nr:PQQ-binding-like beta-propeller repeat protein [Polystyrenella longa]QDU80999.1 outer membrane biogenesis protein BamB [Polystyrenella longa]
MRLTFRFSLLLALVAMTCLSHGTSSVQADEWRQFRGNDCTSLALDASLPLEFGEDKNIAWKKSLVGRGLSGPIVVSNRVYLTSSSGFDQSRLHVLCYDAESGDQLWERTFAATGRTICHEKMCVATPTPASDGERIFAFFSSNDVACLDLDGNLLWYRGLTFDYPNASNSLGMSSSPIVVDDVAIFQVECDADSLAFGLDTRTGETKWQLSRPRRANWTSPSVYPVGDSSLQQVALLQSSAGLDAINPQDGKTLWSFEDGASTIPSSVVAGETIYVPSNGVTAIKPHASSPAPEMLGSIQNLSPSTPSPIAFDGKVYTVNRSGVLACGDVEAEKRLWQLRLGGRFSSTPIIADGKMYAFNEEGICFVVDLTGDKGKIVSENPLNETILCTPAVAHNAMFVRSDDTLWKIASEK